jgi:hypothetical protein
MTTLNSATKVFIAGSRRLSRLSKDVKRRIDNIVGRGFTVIVGDANGADKAVQAYLNGKRYSHVVVFCMEGGCRNNVGDWPTRMITAAGAGRRDFVYYSTKDRAMVEEAEYALMLWDGRSRGTLTSIVQLVQQGKPVVVYVAPHKSFYTLRQPDHLVQMLGGFDPAALDRIDRELRTVAMGRGSSRKVDTAPLF